MNTQKPLNIGLIIYPDMTQLDITGPHQVFSFFPNTKIHWVWKTLEPVKSNGGLTILPTNTFSDCPQLDLFCVPGGALGQIKMMEDEDMLAFLRKQAEQAQYITSVCTGALILGAAGLLRGYKAATHWAFREQLALLGATVSKERVVIDRNRITGGGVTAGIDFALTIAGKLYDEKTAKSIELLMEYNPSPPFGVGTPDTAGVDLVEYVKMFAGELTAESLKVSKEAGNNLGI